MRQIITFLLSLTSISTFAQTEPLTKEILAKELQPLRATIQTLQRENGSLKAGISTLRATVLNADRSIDSLQRQTQLNSNAIAQTANELVIKITRAETTTNQKITEVDKSLSKNSLYAIIGVLLALFLSALIYLLLNNRQKKDKTEVINELNRTKTSIEEGLVKELGKQTDLIESQLQLLTQQKIESPKKAEAEPDHSLALKVADQITAIERAVSLIDAKTKGLQRIKNSVTNLKDNLVANGYELIDLLGKQLNQGMNIIVTNSTPDENLKKDDEIITRIIKPQVNFNDKMIQAAQVEVSVGY